jgi:hypothetical protein
VKIERAHKLIAFALLIGGIGWWWFGHISMANDDHDEQVILVDAVEKLTTIHVRQDTVAQAEDAMIEKLCRAGKLDPIDCPGMLPAVSAPAPLPEEIE